MIGGDKDPVCGGLGVRSPPANSLLFCHYPLLQESSVFDGPKIRTRKSKGGAGGGWNAISRPRAGSPYRWIRTGVLCNVGYHRRNIFYKAQTLPLPVPTIFSLLDVPRFSRIQNDVYRFPDLSLCQHDNYGCDDVDMKEECVASTNMTDGGVVAAVYHPDQDDEQHISTFYTVTDTVRTTYVLCAVRAAFVLCT